MSDKKRLLWVGDAACPSGFAVSTHKILEVVHQHYDVTVLALNYRGDPHTWPYHIYAAAVGGDMFGVARLIWMCDLVKPDVIVIQNDPWNFPMYIRQLKQFKEYANVPVVGIVAVDGLNCMGDGLNGLEHAVFWTEFGLKEARKGGYQKEASVIPLGVDLQMYYPMDKLGARYNRQLPAVLDDAFIVGNVNRNQPRKRWDLTMRYFAKWVHSGPLKDAYLYLHVAPTGDMGISVKQLAQYYGIFHQLLLMEPAMHYGIAEEQLRDTYNAFDVQISTTQGEGFGLTTFEGMACGVPQILPDWSALGELTRGAAELIPCPTTSITTGVNVIGGVPDEDAFVKALDNLWRRPERREELREAGLQRVNEERFRWNDIANRFTITLHHVMERVARERKDRVATTEEVATT